MAVLINEEQKSGTQIEQLSSEVEALQGKLATGDAVRSSNQQLLVTQAENLRSAQHKQQASLHRTRQQVKTCRSPAGCITAVSQIRNIECADLRFPFLSSKSLHTISLTTWLTKLMENVDEQELEQALETMQVRIHTSEQEKQDLLSQLASSRTEQQELLEAFSEARDRLESYLGKVQVLNRFHRCYVEGCNKLYSNLTSNLLQICASRVS